MKHFLKISPTSNVGPILSALKVNEDLWDMNTLRTSHPDTPHKDVSDIWLWFNDLSDNVADAIDDVQTRPYEGWWRLPQVRPLVFDLMRFVEATQIGRCVITKLPAGKVISPHVDQGTPATFYTRFQIALQSAAGCNFIIEDEQVNFKQGEVWMINNKAEHSVVNNSAEDRIALIVDLRIPTC